MTIGLAGSVFPSGCHRHPSKAAVHKVIVIIIIIIIIIIIMIITFRRLRGEGEGVCDAKVENAGVASCPRRPDW